ncbi:hypothetical protein ACORG1_34710 (plasmid) [Mycobacterium sp. TJFP1]
MASDNSAKKARADKKAQAAKRARKPRNNAARKAALEHQREHPGTRYIAAREAVTRPAKAPVIWYKEPCYHRLLDAYGLVLSEQFAILARWAQMRQQPTNVEVPIGLSTGTPVHLPFGAGSRHYAVVARFGEGQLAGLGIVEALLTSLLASCDPDLLDVWLIGNRHDLRGRAYLRAWYDHRAELRASGGPVDALWAGLVGYWPDPYYPNRERGMVDWVDYEQLGAELDWRQDALSAAAVECHSGAEDHGTEPALPHLLVVTSCPHGEQGRATIRRALQQGPALGVHVMVIAESLSDCYWEPLSEWCDMVITQPGVTTDEVPWLAERDGTATSHLVITPSGENGSPQARPYEPFLDTGNGLWLPVYGANTLHAGAPVLSLSLAAGSAVQIHLAATRSNLDVSSPDVVRDAGGDLLPWLVGERQVVSLTDVALVGHPQDTAAVVEHLLAQLPDGIVEATTRIEDQNVRLTILPPPAGDYFALLPGGHRIIEARDVEDLPPLAEHCYRIDVSRGGQELVVQHPEDKPRERRVDVVAAG